MNPPRLLCRLAADRSGAALIEFAIGLPVLLTGGLWAAELTNYALTNQRLSQVALALADNSSRVGLFNGTGTTQMREVDLNDVLLAAKQQGAPFNLTANGRITLSSLENSNGTQRIHWQRCIGAKSGVDYDSHYGKTLMPDGVTYDPRAGVNTAATGDNSASNPGTLAPNGMGETGAQVNAPANSGVMFVEINYLYTPIVGNGWFASPKVLRYIASFVVRDNRDYGQVYNPAPAASRSTCDLYAA
ncbi:TadE/TadG family type IV pilus assembly protein [Sphingomonas elodea]|uniref:TadE/TadG family type IV pilus assembly protein n=1 Tax=Sphingomonas elodea TaxID=179878 RepID=UPI0002630AD0|nr:tight adherence protein TadE [Sphingomonas elodea]